VNIPLLIETAYYLRPKQIVYQIKRHFLKPKLGNETFQAVSCTVKIAPTIAKYQCYEDGNQFTFLNIRDNFENWNMQKHGALWVYNLNYMDWLEQDNITTEECLRWIDKFIDELPNNQVGLDPYPIALRIINWAKFFCKHPNCINQRRQNCMYAQTQLLWRKLEYHILGNHLLEDAYALFIASIFFNDSHLHKKAKDLLADMLKEQILPDGAHYEQSPMYHCIMLDRLLDCINFSDNNIMFDGQELFTTLLKDTASQMLGHLQSIVYRDGFIPLLNDSAYGIAPTADKLFLYAERLHISWTELPLKECGYRKMGDNSMEILVDIGNITATYQPGHTHADTFNYELRLDDQPIIIDTGISTYNKNDRRQYERSTAAHNTVSVGGKDSSHVWGGFRVGRRAKVTVIKDSHDEIVARHNGFGNDIIHQRHFLIDDKTLYIEDNVIGRPIEAISYLHFSPQLHAELISEADGIVKVGQITIKAEGFSCMTLTQEEASITYNKRQPCDILAIYFTKHLKYSIKKT